MKSITFSPAVKATGSYTIVDYTALALKVATVNGIALTEGTHWTAATSNAATATSLAAAITTATATTTCTATTTLNVVSITANTAGSAGNSITLATTDAVNLLRSAATLAGGKYLGENGTAAFSGPGRVKSIAVKGTGTSLNCQVLNGITASGIEYDLVTGLTTKTVVRTYKNGLFMPTGCFLIPQVDLTAITIEYTLI